MDWDDSERRGVWWLPLGLGLSLLLWLLVFHAGAWLWRLLAG